MKAFFWFVIPFLICSAFIFLNFGFLWLLIFLVMIIIALFLTNIILDKKKI